MMVGQNLDLEQLLADPKAHFELPEHVLTDPRLTLNEKRDILLRWERDARELSVAEEEGMGGGEAHMLERVTACLRRLKAAPDGSPGVPDKLG